MKMKVTPGKVVLNDVCIKKRKRIIEIRFYGC